MAKPKRDLRSMCLAARDGDHSAAKAVLRLYGFDALAREIKRNFPFSNRVRRQIDALTCAIRYRVGSRPSAGRSATTAQSPAPYSFRGLSHARGNPAPGRPSRDRTGARTERQVGKQRTAPTVV